MSDPNAFVWYDLITDDVPGALAFYGAVVGWSGRDAGPGFGGYHLISAGTQDVAGALTRRPDMKANGSPTGWVGYVGVRDIDDAAARLREAGGAVYLGPAEIPTVGRFAVVADPQGAVFQLFQPHAPRGDEPCIGTPGHVGWHELYAADWETVFPFYSGLFGWTKGPSVDMGPMGTYQLFEAGGVAIGGMMTSPPGGPRPSWQYYFTVEAIHPAARRVREAGGSIVPCRDPEGNAFALVAPDAGAPPAEDRG